MNDKLNELRNKHMQLQAEDKALSDERSNLINSAHMLYGETERVRDIAHYPEKYLEEIERDFAASTGIVNPVDISFLGVAIILQCLRWMLLNKVTQRKKEGESGWEDLSHKLHDKILKKEPVPEDLTNILKNKHRPYYASLNSIISDYSVPYDAIKGTKEFGVAGPDKGLVASQHRYRTLGHDPVLGIFFGTANILTSTLTNWRLQTYFVESSMVVGHASTLAMAESVITRATEEPVALGASAIKQGLHILSDVYTKNGIPVPLVQTLSPELAKLLADFGMDTGGLIKAAGSAKLAALIDSLIAIQHAKYWDSTSCSLQVYEVRTRKILSISKMIAEGSNIIATLLSGNVTDFDLGGFAYSVYKIINDVNFMTDIKLEYMSSSFRKKVEGSNLEVNI